MSVAPQVGQRLLVHTQEIPDPADLLSCLPDAAPLVFLRRGEGLVGFGQAARLDLRGGADRFTRAVRWLARQFTAAQVHDPLQIPGSGAVAFASFTFDAAAAGSVLIVPAVVIGRRAGRAWRTTIGPATTPPPTPPLPAGDLRFHDTPKARARYQHAVTAALRRIHAGHLDKVVLARDLPALCDTPIDPRPVLTRLAARFPDCYTFSCAGLIGATPELLAERHRRHVTSLVLAGTAPRGHNPAEDTRLGRRLRASAKDRTEHRYSVQTVTRILSGLCADLTADPTPWLLRLANVQHLATRVSGQLTTPLTALEIAGRLHPTPAVCGTPTAAALTAITELEAMDRGRYCGPVGWVDARGDGQWAIALRCAQLDGDQARLYAGGGIVADSDPAAEALEADNKLNAMRQALLG